jgi:beta-glucanase (GH16 family)
MNSSSQLKAHSNSMRDMEMAQKPDSMTELILHTSKVVWVAQHSSWSMQLELAHMADTHLKVHCRRSSMSLEMVMVRRCNSGFPQNTNKDQQLAPHNIGYSRISMKEQSQECRDFFQ